MIASSKTIGHHQISKYLSGVVKSKSLNHAYIFSGAEGLGKKRMAQDFVTTLVGCDGLIKPHSDVLWVERLEDKKHILLEQVHDLQNFLALSALENGYKIVIIDAAERMNKEASNCLLKTLEEPAKNAILILTTSSKSSLLPTIISRCENIPFLSVPRVRMKDNLIKVYGDNDEVKINLIISLSQGKPAIAARLMESEQYLEQYKQEKRELVDFVSNGMSDRLASITKMLEKKSFNESAQIARRKLNNLAVIFHDILNKKTKTQSYSTDSFTEAAIGRLEGRYNLEELKNIFNKLQESRRSLSLSVNPKIVLQNLVINL